MAQVTFGSATVTWAGTANTLLAVTATKPMEASLSINRPEVDFTQLTTSTTGVLNYSFGSSIGDWSATLKARFEPGQVGNTGFVTAASAFLANIRAYTLTLESSPKETTALIGGPVVWKTFIPSIIRGSGSWTAAVDDTTALVVPGGTAHSATFKLIENASSDHTLAAECITTGSSFTAKVGEVGLVTVPFVLSGAITAAGTSAAGTFTISFQPSPGPKSRLSSTSPTPST